MESRVSGCVDSGVEEMGGRIVVHLKRAGEGKCGMGFIHTDITVTLMRRQYSQSTDR